MSPARLESPRLVLRQWTDADRAPFAALNADPEVMRHFPSPLTREASDAAVDALSADIAARGHGFWAAETREEGAFIGFVGITVPRRPLPFSPCVEIGWRLARAHWHRGYATEGAQAALRHGFEALGLDEIVSFTAASNLPSQAVMRRLGMVRDVPGDFDHPAVPEGHPVRAHVLYRLARADWTRATRPPP